MRIRIDESAYSKKFHSILHSEDRFIIAYGSRGSGKTDTFYLKYLVSLFEPFPFRLAYINKEFSSIRDQQFAGFKRVAKRIGLYDQLKFYEGDYRIVNPQNGNYLVPKGMDDSEKTKGMDEITAIWWDEVSKGTKLDFNTLNELLRSPTAKYLQFALSFNPVHENHWLRHTFFHPDDAYTIHPDFKNDTLLHHSTFRDNEFIDQEEYYKTLTRGATDNSIRVNVFGEWGLGEPVVNPFFDAFNETVHVREAVEHNPNLPFLISMDFNVDPLCGIVGQVDRPRKFISVFDEITVNNGNIKDLCIEIERIIEQYKVPRSRIKITGDYNGNAKKIGLWDNKSAYINIKERLRLSSTQIKVPSNPFVKNSRADCNEILMDWDVRIDKRCIKLISDLQTVACNSEGEIIKRNRKKESERADHSDAYRYLNNTFAVLGL